MAEKKLPRHKRMYKDSPKLERGDDGSMKSVKPSEKEKESTEVQSGVDDVAGDDIDPAGDARLQELDDMYKRHRTEMQSYHKRHMKEEAKKREKTEAAADTNEEEGAGEKVIKDVKKETAE